jgi:hypothetical protein
MTHENGSLSAGKPSRREVRVFANKPDADARTPLTDEHFVGSFRVLDWHAGVRGGAAGKHIFLLNGSPGSSNFFRVAPPGEPYRLKFVPVGTSSEGKEFFLNVNRVTLRVYQSSA